MQNGESAMDKSSKPSNSSRAWAVKARQYLALRDEAYLKDAIAEAEKDGSRDIAAILTALQNEDFQSINERAPRLHQSLINDEREKEAWTVALVDMDMQAQLAEKFDQFPPEQQPGALKIGLEASLKAVEIARQLGDRPCLGLYISLIAKVFTEQTRLDEAEKAYTEALDIYRKLTKEFPEVYEQYVAGTLNNRSNVLRDLNRLEEAEKNYTEALDIYRKLARKHPEIYEQSVVVTLNNRGNVLRDLNLLEEAERDFTELLDVYRNLVEKHPEVYERVLAATLNDRGIVLSDLNRLDEAEGDFAEAINISRKLAEKHPEIYELDVAAALNNRGNVLRDLNRLEEAEKIFSEALDVYSSTKTRSFGPGQSLLALPEKCFRNRGGEAMNRTKSHGLWPWIVRFKRFLYWKLKKMPPEIYEPNVAEILNNRSIVFRGLNRPEEAEKDINEALRIRRKLAEKHPEIYEPDVAVTLNNCGTVLSDLNRPDEAEKIFTEALDIYRNLAEKRPEVYEPNVAEILNNRSIVFRGLNRPEEAEKDINEALEIRRKLAKKHPKIYEPDLSGTLNNRGDVLWVLNRPHDAEKDYTEALNIYRKLAKKHPEVYEPNLAFTLNNRGDVFCDLNQPEEAERDFGEALGIRRKLAKKHPEIYEPDLAVTLNNLGNALRDLNRLEDAEKTFTEALDIYRKLAKKHPKIYEPDLAVTLNNLGVVLNDLKRPEAAEIWYKKAVEINRRRPGSHRLSDLSTNLGRLLNETEKYSDALEYLKEAVQIVEQRRSLAIGLDRRMQVLRENATLYEQLLICLMKLRRFPEALEIAEKGKSRTLVDLLSLSDLMPKSAPPEIVQQYKQMLFRARMLNEKLHLLNESFSEKGGLLPDKTATWQEKQIESTRYELTKAQGKLNKLAEKIREHDPDFLPHAKPLNLNEIKELAKQVRSSLVLFRVTGEGCFVFIVFPDGETDVIEVKDFTTDRLKEMLMTFDDRDNPVDGWLHHYFNYRQLSRSEVRGQLWFEVIERVTGELYEELLKHVHESLNNKFGKNSKNHKIVLVPNRGLAILPLHACWWQENGKKKYLLDSFTVSYAPSLSVYKRCHEREEEGRVRDSLFGIANPDPPGDLTFSEWECTEIERMLGEKNCRMLWRDAATKQKLMEWLGSNSWAHFSCHGEYRMDQPLESAIFLAGKNEADRLTLGDIFEDVNLPKSWLVVLSACETGLVDFTEIADEHFGLPIGFIYAGAPTVWCSLWKVNDNSTALLMIKAYDELLKNNKSKPEALIAAQKWVREATRDEIIDFAEQRGRDISSGNVLMPQVESFLRELKNKYKKSDQPFSHPYYWAAMQSVGV